MKEGDRHVCINKKEELECLHLLRTIRRGFTMSNFWPYSSYVLLRQHYTPRVSCGEEELRETIWNNDENNESIKVSTIPCCHFKNRRTTNHWWTLINILLSILCIAIISTWAKDTYSLSSILKKSSYYCNATLSFSPCHTSTHTTEAPILNRLTLPITTKQIQGSLFPPTNPSIGRAFPNPESDAMWEEIETTRTIAITTEDVRRLGKDPDTAVRFDDKVWGLGGDAFMGQIGEFVVW